MSRDMETSSDAWIESGPAADASPSNPLLLVHRALRGRYLIAVAVGAVLAGPMAYVGYTLMPPVYTSTGMVTIDPTQPVILDPNEANEAITGFDSFIRSQARILQSPRVLQNAANILAERRLWTADNAGRAQLAGLVTVDVPKGSRDLFVTVTHPDPRLGQEVTNAVLTAYIDVAVTSSDAEWKSREDALEAIIRNAELERNAHLNNVRTLTEAEGVADLDRHRLYIQDQIESLGREIQSLRIELAAFGEGETSSGNQASPRELTVDEFAQLDPELQNLLSQQRTAEQRLATLALRFTEKHRDRQAAHDELDLVRARVAKRLEELRSMSLNETTGGIGLTGKRQRLAVLEAIHAERTVEANRLGAVSVRIDREQDSASASEERLQRASQRLQSLRTERTYQSEGRIRISQQADLPTSPSKDRRKPLAAMGAFGGIGLSIVGFAGFGIVRARYRFVSDLEDEAAAPPVLGLVPEVEQGRIEGDEAAQAGVHQIRSLLESMAHADGARVVVITSSTAAEGKSTLAAALSASMAQAGRRTLLIDADLHGRGLTSRLAARSLAGLSDRVLHAHDNGEIHEVEGRLNLHLMPAGVAPGFNPEQLSGRAMADLLATLRTRYESIVIDTGPILGSLEANAVVPLADHVVLVVSRGQNTRLVKVAIDRLRRFRAGRIGLVFNRAARADIERSTSAASISVRSRAASRPEPQTPPALSAGA